MSYNWNADVSRGFSGPAKGDYHHTLVGNADQQMPWLSSTTDGGNPKAHIMRQLTTFFGSVSQDAIDRQKENSMGHWDQETSDYPEAFSDYFGSNSSDSGWRGNSHVASILIEKTKASENWQLTYMAPWRESRGLMQSWSQVKFNKHMLDREPEQAVPRLLTSTRTSGSAGLVRYGIALMLEATFASTPQGVQTYLLNLEQIRIATVETCSYGVMVQIMTNKPYEYQFKRGHSRADLNDKSTIDRELRKECRFWALVHKEKNGYDSITAEMKRTLKARGVDDTNFVVIPAGMGHHMRLVADNKFYLTGREATNNVTRDLANWSEKSSGLIIVESRGFSQGEGQDPHDPCFREQTIGDFMTLDDSTIQNCPPEQYRTYMLNTLGFNMEKDGWFEFRYADLYQKAGVWDFHQHMAPLTDKIGRYWGHDSQFYTHGQMAHAWSNNYERLLKCLINLPQEKQRELRSALRLIEEKDFEARFDLESGKVFEKRLFDEMFDQGEGCKFEMAKTYGVGDHERFKRVAESYTYDEEYETFKRRKTDSYRESIVPSADAYKELSTPEVKEDIGDEMDYEIIKETGSGLRPDVYLRQTVKAKRKAIPESLQGGEVAPVVDPTVRAMDKIATEILYVVGVTVTREGVNAALELQKKKNPNSIEFVVGDWVERLMAFKCSNAQRLVCLSEFKRVLVNELIKVDPSKKAVDNAKSIGANGVEKVKIGLITGFVPFLGQFQTRWALDQIRLEQTAIERLMQKDPSRDLAEVDREGAREGWWNVDIDPDRKTDPEDGQIKLAVVPGGDDAKYALSLPHDTYATTLAANHTVLFNLTSSQLARMGPVTAAAGGTPAITHWTLNTVENAKRGRTDALAWSAFVSTLITKRATFVDTNAVDAYVKTMDSDSKNRLKRVAAGLTATDSPQVLECQSHLSGLIKLAHLCARAIFFTHEASVKENVIKQALDALRNHQTLGFDVTQKEQLRTTIQHGYVVEPSAAPAAAAAPALPAASIAKIDAGAQPTAVVWTRDVIHNLLQRASLASGEFIRFCVDNDIPVALYARVWRPHKTMTMGSMIRMKAGKDGAAVTYYKKPDFMMADNAAQKTIYGHYTMYNKTVILRPEQVVLMHNVYCSGYVGGWGVSVWDPLDDYHSDQYSDSHLEHDCFITLGPMYHTTSGDQETSWRSLTGVVPDSLHAREDVHEMMKYPGCKAIANHWHWLTNAKDYGQGQNVEYKIAVDPTERKQNVLCFQAAQMKWNMHDGDFTKVVTDEGHWGQDIDRGLRNVLDGTSPMIKKAFYNGGRQTELY